MIVYSASILFDSALASNHIPAFGTKLCHGTIESFLDFCELSARQNEFFSISDVYINCVEIEVAEDGTATKINSKVRNLKKSKS